MADLQKQETFEQIKAKVENYVFPEHLTLSLTQEAYGATCIEVHGKDDQLTKRLRSFEPNAASRLDALLESYARPYHVMEVDSWHTIDDVDDVIDNDDIATLENDVKNTVLDWIGETFGADSARLQGLIHVTAVPIDDGKGNPYHVEVDSRPDPNSRVDLGIHKDIDENVVTEGMTIHVKVHPDVPMFSMEMPDIAQDILDNHGFGQEQTINVKQSERGAPFYGNETRLEQGFGIVLEQDEILAQDDVVKQLCQVVELAGFHASDTLQSDMKALVDIHPGEQPVMTALVDQAVLLVGEELQALCFKELEKILPPAVSIAEPEKTPDVSPNAPGRGR
jgi:hypothetical protein